MSPRGTTRLLARLLALLPTLLLMSGPVSGHPLDARLPSGYRALEFDDWTWASRAGGPRPTLGQQETITHSLARLRGQLGVAPRRRPLVVYTSDRGAFERVVTELGADPPADGVLALAFPARGVLVLDGSRLRAFRTGGFPQTVTHELAHVVIGEVSPAVPRWYHEGLAQWLSGQFIDVRNETDIIARASRGQLYSFDDLSRFLPRQHGRMSLLYVQSHMFVRDLDRRHGTDVHRRILAAMAQGAPFKSAFARATDSTLAAEEERWLRGLRSRHSWVTWYIQYVGLFPTLAVLVILGFFFQRSIRRRRLARMAAEERALYGPDV